jgi:excisionase family DNA binding protein
MKDDRLKTEHAAKSPPLTLSLAGAARLYGFDAGTLREAISRGDLRASRPTKRTIRILRTEIERWLELHAVPSEAGGPAPRRKTSDHVVRKRLTHEKGRRLRLRKRASS